MLIFSTFLSGCLHTRGSAPYNGYMKNENEANVKSSSFFIQDGDFSIRCGEDDVYIVIERFSNDRANIKALPLRSDKDIYHFAPNHKKNDISEGRESILRNIGGKVFEFQTGKGIQKFVCEGRNYYIHGAINSTLKAGDLRIDYIDKIQDLNKLKSSYSRESIKHPRDLDLFLRGFDDTKFSDYVRQQFFMENISVKVKNIDTDFKQDSQSGFASTTKGSCKNITKDIEFSLSPKSQLTDGVSLDVDFKIDPHYSPSKSQEGTEIIYKNPVISKNISLTKNNRFKHSVRVEYPCVIFSTRYVYVYRTDFLLKGYTFKIDVKRIGT